MSRASRRGFIKLTGAGVAAAGVGGLASASLTSAGAAAPSTGAVPAASLPAGASGSLVAHISDVRAGEIVVMAGQQEVTIVDHALVAKLARTLQSGSTNA